MSLNGLEWGGDYRPHGREGLKLILEDRMNHDLDRYLEELSEGDRADRRNGGYRRHLLAESGDIELSAPRTRRYSAVRVVRSYARRAGQIDRMILACFVSVVSTRKVAEALLPVWGEPVSPSTVSRVAKLTGEPIAFPAGQTQNHGRSPDRIRFSGMNRKQ